MESSQGNESQGEELLSQETSPLQWNKANCILCLEEDQECWHAGCGHQVCQVDNRKIKYNAAIVCLPIYFAIELLESLACIWYVYLLQHYYYYYVVTPSFTEFDKKRKSFLDLKCPADKCDKFLDDVAPKLMSPETLAVYTSPLSFFHRSCPIPPLNSSAHRIMKSFGKRSRKGQRVSMISIMNMMQRAY